VPGPADRHDAADGRGQRSHDSVGLRGTRLTVAPIDEYCITANRAPGHNVLGAISHQKAPTQVDGEAIGGRAEHPGAWFSTAAAGVLAVRAHLDGVDCDATSQRFVHLVHDVALDVAIADIRLIGDHDDEKARRAQAANRHRSSGQQPEILGSAGRIGLPVPHVGAIQHTVTIEEHGAAPSHRPLLLR
jgi:hypothetical protein